MVEESQDKPRARYVWDRDKLAWVETAEEPRGEEPAREESVAEAAHEEAIEELPAQVLLSEAAAEMEGEELQYRGAWIRLAALIIDGVIILIFNLIGRQIVGDEGGVASWLVTIISVGYFIGFWAWRGQTVGKMVIGAKIVRVDGSPLGIGRAILRYLGYFVYLLMARLIPGPDYKIFIIIAVALFFVALNRNKRGLHDLLPGTVVINSHPKPLEDYEEEEEYEEASEAVEADTSEDTWDTSQS
jgi:uncharacterized RDD family membrane protein YckC